MFPLILVPQTFVITAAAPEFTSAEFAIQGFSSEYVIISMIPNPDATAVGDPLGSGARITFAKCQRYSAVLYTVTVLRFHSAPNLAAEDISFVAHESPSHPELGGPEIVLCGAQTAEAVRVFGSAERLLPPAANPFPADGATEVDVNPELRWQTFSASSCWLSSTMQQLYFGTEPDPPFHTWVENVFELETLLPNTTYYWRVIEGGAVQYAVSPVWSFTTGVVVPAQPQSWSSVKGLFR